MSRLRISSFVVMLCCGLGLQAYGQDCVLQGLWEFEEGSGLTAADSAAGNDGALTNMDDSAWVAGRVGDGALSFDGEDDYVVVPDSDDLDIFTDHTWAVWFRTDQDGGIMSKGPTDVSWDDDNYRGGRGLFVRGGVLAVDVGWVGDLNGGTPVVDNEWHHAAMTVEFNTDGDNDTMNLYLDGELDGTNSDWDINSQVPIASPDIKFGFVSPDFPESGPYLRGEVDDPRIFNCALTAEEIAELAAGGGGADTYTLGFDGPGSVSGGAGETASAEHVATLTHSGPGTGAQGWSIGVVADGGDIVSATTDGTTTEELFDGGFTKTALTVGEGNEGAVSAVVLCFGCPAELPAEATLLAFGVDWTIPEGGGTGTLRYQEGLVGEGQPVQLVVTVVGVSVEHGRDTMDVQLIEVMNCCDAAYRVGFSSESLRNSTPGEGIVDGDPDNCVAAGGTIEASGPTTVYAAVSSNAEAGVQGFSVSVEVTGDIDVVDVTTDGTGSAPEPDGHFNGGFNKTGVANAEASGGRRGAVSAVVFCFGCPATLDPVGTESILALSIGAESDTASGRLFFAPGLVGEGQPVDNVLTVDGSSADVCNIDIADVTVNIAPSPGLGPYLRGDPNDDGDVNIADSIWIVNELFGGGPESSCQAAADANGDGAVDLADTSYLISYRFLGGDAPPAPFPDCDTSPFEEAPDLTCDSASACE